MCHKSENPSGQAGALKKCACEGRCKVKPITSPPKNPPKIEITTRRELENLRFELMECGDDSLTTRSTIKAVGHLLRNH